MSATINPIVRWPVGFGCKASFEKSRSSVTLIEPTASDRSMNRQPFVMHDWRIAALYVVNHVGAPDTTHDDSGWNTYRIAGVHVE